MPSLAIAPILKAILAAMRQALTTPSEENIQALADVAGLSIKKPSPTDFTLSTYTEAELRAQEAVLKAAEAKRQADEKSAKDKAIADKQVGDFRLSGSSMPSDVAASYGQNDMFAVSRRDNDVHNYSFENQTFSIGETVKIAKSLPYEKGVITKISNKDKTVTIDDGRVFDFGFIFKNNIDDYKIANKGIDAKLLSAERMLNEGSTIDVLRNIRDAESQIKQIAGKSTIFSSSEDSAKNEYFANQYQARIDAAYQSLRLLEVAHDERIKQQQEQSRQAKENESQKPKKEAKTIQMTTKEWKETHKDSKGMIDGKRSVMLPISQGGGLAFVEIVKEKDDMFVQTRGQQAETPKNYGDFEVGTKDFLAAENIHKMAESFSDNDGRVGGIRFKVKYDKNHKDHNLKNISPIGYKVIKAMLKSAQTLISLSSVDIKVYIQAPLFMEGATGLAHDYFVGNDNKRNASISINSKYIANAISGSDESRGQLARLAETIAHELWHIRQHYDKKLISGSGVWTWLGKDYRRIKYENRPWEIEAKKVGQTLSPKVIDDLVGQNLISISDAGYIKKAILNSNYIDYADDESAKYDDLGGFTFTPAIALNSTLDAIMALAKNNSQANAERLAQLLGVKLAPKQELDMFGEPIQSQGFDLFGEPIQDGDDSPVEELPRLAVIELPLSKLTLSEDVPQFKSGADDESGVVEALGGKFDRTGVAPIQVWERTDGRLEIISGRHRTDLARRSGEKTIPAQVHKESEGFTAKQAMMLDAELNIRDGQGKVKDYVDYFSHSEISEAEADKRGLLARSIGQRAFTIASKGSEELLTLHRNDIISDQAAADIANIAPNNSAMQAVGLRVLQEHKPLNNALNTIRAVMALTREKGQEPDTFDLFGFDDSALKEAEAMARIASRKQRQIAEQLNAIKGAVKNPKLAAKHGVVVENEADALAKVKTMTAQKARWDNWSSHADLLAEVRQEISEKGGYDSILDDECFDEYDSLAMPSLTDYDVVDIDTDEIKLNPTAYQWRNNVTGDGTEKGRVIAGTFNYDDQPPLILHRRLSGRVYLADGHHRYKMAKASHAPIVKAIVLDEHDGYTVPAMRVLCGFLNLRKEALVKDRVKLPMVNMAKTADLVRKAVENEMGWA